MLNLGAIPKVHRASTSIRFCRDPREGCRWLHSVVPDSLEPRALALRYRRLVSLTVAPETLIEAGTFWTVALNRNQNLIGKTMVVANRHVESVTALEPDEWLDLHRQISRVKLALDDLFNPDQCNFAFLMNADAQVHLHVVPRYRTERVWAEQTFTDPHFGELYGKEQRILPPADLVELASAIRIRLAD